ncbi:hypothetical protein AAG906_029655 [Vitis piasezkii]
MKSNTGSWHRPCPQSELAVLEGDFFYEVKTSTWRRLPGSRQWWSPPTREDVFYPDRRRRWSPPRRGDVFDNVCDASASKRLARLKPTVVFTHCGQSPERIREKGENKDDKWVSYGGSRQTKMRREMGE